jgi:predicted RNA-binding protein with PIN domain
MEGSPYYIVDGYNVIFGGGFDGKDVRAARRMLLDHLEGYVRKKRVRITVVWDGGRQGSPDGGSRLVRNLNAGCLSADEKIVRMVESMENPRSATVVSDDRRHIRGIVRNLGAQVLSVAEFLRVVGYAPSGRRRGKRYGPGQPSDAQSRDAAHDKEGADDMSVEQWLQLFTFDRNDRR